jgi:hypothetical protein
MNYCKGIPGEQIHRTDEELIGGICPACEDKLITTRSWGSASPSELKGQTKGPGIVINHKKHTPPPSKNFRNYPK